jgi:hypothetical protein
VSIDLSTPGRVARGATVLVASGIIAAVAGDFPFSSLARRGPTASNNRGAEGSLIT